MGQAEVVGIITPDEGGPVGTRKVRKEDGHGSAAGTPSHVIQDPTYAVGSASANGIILASTDVSGYSMGSVAFDGAGIGAGTTIIFESSEDGTTWSPMPVFGYGLLEERPADAFLQNPASGIGLPIFYMATARFRVASRFIRATLAAVGTGTVNLRLTLSKNAEFNPRPVRFRPPIATVGGNLHVAAKEFMFQMAPAAALDTTYWTQTAVGSGSFAAGGPTPGHINTIGTGNTANSSIKLASVLTLVQMGLGLGGVDVLFKLAYDGTLDSRNVQRYGIFNAQQGVFLRKTGVVVELVVRFDGVDSVVTASNAAAINLPAATAGANADIRFICGMDDVSVEYNGFLVYRGGFPINVGRMENCSIRAENENTSGFTGNIVVAIGNIIVERVGSRERPNLKTYTVPDGVSVGNTSTALLAASTTGTERTCLVYVDPKAVAGVHINVGGAATTSKPFLAPGKGIRLNTNQAINAIREAAAVANVNVYVISGVS